LHVYLPAQSSTQSITYHLFAQHAAQFNAHPLTPLTTCAFFYFFLSSDAGHYVPATAHRVYLGNKNLAAGDIKINMVGMAVGNGLTDPEVQYQFYPQMLYNYTQERLGKPLISLQEYEKLESEVPGCVKLIKACQTDPSACGIAQELCNATFFPPYQQTGRNTYDIRIPCAKPPLCYDFSPVTKFLEAPSTLKALNIAPQSHWSQCNFNVNRQFSGDWMKNYQNQIPDLLNAGIRVLIYAGDCDFICNWLGNKAWTLKMDWPGRNSFNAAQDHDWNNGKGIARTSKNFTFLQVHNAGYVDATNEHRLVNNAAAFSFLCATLMLALRVCSPCLCTFERG
jgi:cathepsin A (carboxypeptidase C)